MDNFGAARMEDEEESDRARAFGVRRGLRAQKGNEERWNLSMRRSVPVGCAHMKPILAAIFFASAVVVQGQDEPRIKVVKSDKLTVALTGVAAADAEVLKKDLAMSGYF